LEVVISRHDTFDPVINRVITKFVNRSNAGMDKYGVAMTRGDISPREWLIHLQEELMDGVNYIEAWLFREENDTKR
jgi:hypothetical protein